eukprot:TRINITY_DN88238_c4_g1_i1.p1 TRINITY_DN88238_c4_g1~~TRINITY_DN88238_c4_g1_i1.p1  ORF type:complete len:557 (+),score=64.29 TRINITY_DN88238_c4_g1_i1:1909-3579(+)
MKTTVTFQVAAETQFGENISVVGNDQNLGDWDVRLTLITYQQATKGKELKTSGEQYPKWVSEPVSVGAHKPLEYKYIKMRGVTYELRQFLQGKLVAWENFMGNRTVPLPLLQDNGDLLIRDEGFGVMKGTTEGKKREEEKKVKLPTKPQPHLQTSAEKERIYEEYKKIDFANFMCKTIDILGKGNTEARTWKEKLELVSYIVQNVELENEELAAIGGYLQLINNGQIKCEENGTHYRPNHHANLALAMYTFLIGKINKENSFLIKTILKNLPSFSSKFRSDVPLTRIRDIAHRGDIPGDLKREIKTTLQNKLHRNAGPEDLVTAQNILSKVKAYVVVFNLHARAGTYPSEFVAEFEKFMDELKEFFNAMELDKLLIALTSSLEDVGHAHATGIKDMVGKFLQSKEKAHHSPLNCIKDLSAIREALIELKKDGSDPSVFGYSWNADFQLEDFLFVIVGDFLSSASTPLKSDEELDIFLHVALYMLKNMEYSDYEKEECSCIENGILNFLAMTSNERLYYLRLKSVVDRAMRLIRHLSNTIYNAYQSTVLYERYKQNR